jgi:dolichol-phosphate mannosyltransferase
MDQQNSKSSILHNKTLSLVLLSYNECNNLVDLLPKIPLSIFDEVIAVDAGSTDGTLEVYNENKIPYHIQNKKGRGNAFLLALDIIHSDYIIFFSTDGNENPNDLSKMKNLLLSGYKMVVAGRYQYPESMTDDSDDPLKIRKVFGILGGKVIKTIWNSPIQDAINGFRGFEVEALKKMKLDAPSHEIELQSTIRAAKLGLEVVEFPTQELKRQYDFRKKSAGTLKLTYNLGKFLIKEIFIGNNF